MVFINEENKVNEQNESSSLSQLEDINKDESI